MCAKYCGRPQQHRHHDACGVVVVSLKCAAALAVDILQVTNLWCQSLMSAFLLHKNGW